MRKDLDVIAITESTALMTSDFNTSYKYDQRLHWTDNR